MPVETFTKAGKKRLRWTFKRIIGGERIRKSKVFPLGTGQAEADKIAARWEAEIYSVAEGGKKRRATIGECVELHFRDHGKRWKDLKSRSLVMEKWRDHYDDRITDDLHQWSIDFALALAAAGLSAASIRNVIGYVRAAVKYAFKVGAIDEDQTPRLVLPRVSNERHIYPQRRDMIRLARACTDREVRAAIRIAFYSGMRRSEIIRAKVTPAGYSLADTKNGTPRIIPIHPRIAVLARLMNFTLNRNRFSGQFQKARRDAKLPHVRFHDLRHGAASEMINSGVDLYTVGGVLGHKSVVSTKRYSHLLTERLADAIGKIGKKSPTK